MPKGSRLNMYLLRKFLDWGPTALVFLLLLFNLSASSLVFRNPCDFSNDILYRVDPHSELTDIILKRSNKAGCLWDLHYYKYS